MQEGVLRAADLQPIKKITTVRKIGQKKHFRTKPSSPLPLPKQEWRRCLAGDSRPSSDLCQASRESRSQTTRCSSSETTSCWGWQAGRLQSLFQPARGEPVEPSAACTSILRQAQDEQTPMGSVTLQSTWRSDIGHSSTPTGLDKSKNLRVKVHTRGVIGHNPHPKDGWPGPRVSAQAITCFRVSHSPTKN